MSRKTLRNIPRISYYEPEEPNLDEYVFCRECRDYVYEYCSIHGPLLVVPDSKKLINTDAGIGVFSTLTLPAGIRFGPYRGKITKDIDSVYCWQIYNKDNRPSHVVDAADAERSNWMRYVNCSRHWSEQNLLAYQYKGQVYYRTIRIIPRFTELLVFYGSEFANILNVDLRLYNTSPQVYYEKSKVQSMNDLNNNSPISMSTQIEQKDNVCNNKVEEKRSYIKSKRKLEKSQEASGIKKSKFQKPIKNIDAEDKLSKRNVKKKKIFNTKDQKFEIVIPNDLDSKGIIVLPEINSEKLLVTENDNFQKPLNNNVETKELNMSSKRNQEKNNTFVTKKKKFQKPSSMSTQKNNMNGAQTTAVDTNADALTCNDCFKKYSCDICTFKTNEKRYMVSHLKMHEVPKVFSCNICNYICVHKGKLKCHMKTHTGEKPFSCNICGYSCTFKGNLKRHIRTHTGEKPFSCNICGYSCVQKTHLKNHIRTHTGEKPFSCNICGYSCVQKTHLKNHIRTHTGEKPFSCNICGYSCTQNGDLKRHIRTHTGEKPFSCNICGYSCTLKGNLKRHIRTHTGEKPFTCNICGYSCTRKGDLNSHIRTHTGEKPFSCNICGYSCTHKSSLKRHIITHRDKNSSHL